MKETRIQITAPMHVSSQGFAAGVATALKKVKALPDDATLDEAERELEVLLSQANHNLNFNNGIIAHKHGFDPQQVSMRCKIDKQEKVLYLHIRPGRGAQDESDKDNTGL
jgi:hypothetical protein